MEAVRLGCIDANNFPWLMGVLNCHGAETILNKRAICYNGPAQQSRLGRSPGSLCFHSNQGIIPLFKLVSVKQLIVTKVAVFFYSNE